MVPDSVKAYGPPRFLTYQCLIVQLLSSFLHVGAHFSRSLEKPRDYLFTCLAFPLGSLVVTTFWAVWHLLGRELIFPLALSQFYPDWLNHSTHSIILPINLLLILLVNHKYNSKGGLFTIVYFAGYTVLIHIIKADTGHWVYKYLEVMNEVERAIYFCATGLAVYLLFKVGQLLNKFVHKKPSQRPPLKKKQR